MRSSNTVNGYWRPGSALGILGLRYVVRERVVLISVIVVGFVGASVGLSLIIPPAYTATAAVRVTSEGAAQPPGEEGLRASVNEVVGEDLPRVAMERAGWPGDPTEFEQRLDVAQEFDGDGLLLNVSFSARDPRTAATAANAYARTFVERVEEMSRTRLAGGSLDIAAELTSVAQPPSHLARPRPLLYGAGALGLGALFAAVSVVALEVRTRRWRGEWDAEISLGDPVLGALPVLERGEEAQR